MNRKISLSILKAIAYVGIYGGLLLPLVFIPIVIFPFVFSKLIFFQVVVGITFPAYVMLAWLEPKYRPKAHILYLAIAAYFVALALSVVFAIDPFRAWWGNQERMNGLFTLLHFFAWLTMACSVLRTWTQWRRLLNYEVALSAVMSLVAMLQRIYPNLLLFPVSGRIGGLLDNPIYMAAYQIFNLFFLVLLFLKEKSKGLRIFYAVVAAMDVVAFVMAQSRGALVGLAAGILAFAIYYGLFTKSKKTRYSVLGACLVLFLAYGTLFALRNTSWVSNSVLARYTNFSQTISTRLIAWDIAWKGFLERPVFGWGLDDFHILFNMKYNPQSLRFGSYETWFDRAHNTVLDVMSMTGLVGTITFFGIFAALFFVVWRSYKKGWIDLPIAAILTSLPIAYFVQNLSVFDHPAGFSMSFLMYGLIIAATRPEFIGATPPEEVSTLRDKSWPWAVFAVLQIIALIVVWRCSVLPFKASMISIQASQNAYSTASFDLIQQAADIWTPYLDEQTFLVSRNLMAAAEQGQIDKVPKWQELYALAKTLTTEELRRHPMNTHPHFVYARLLDDMSKSVPDDTALAEQQYKEAVNTSPKRQQVLYSLSRFYLLHGRIDEALAINQQVRDFDLELGQGHWSYGLVLMYDKKDVPNGSKEIVESQKVAYPYYPQDVRELFPLVEAYQAQNDVEGLKKAIESLKTLPAVDPLLYAQLAYRFQQFGMPDLRDKVLQYGSQIDPTVTSIYQQGIQAMASSTKAAATPAKTTYTGPKK